MQGLGENETLSSLFSKSHSKLAKATKTKHKSGERGGEQARGNSSVSGKDEKKKKLKKTEEGVVSTSFPTNRIRSILKDEAPDIRTTPDAVFLFNRATELFLECFAEEAQACARRNHKKSISYDHLSSVVAERNRYEFLSDFVPGRLRAKDALLAVASDES